MYLPVSTPWASGDQTICEIPFSAQRGKTSASGARQIMLYWGWEETNFFAPSTSSPARICSGVHSEKPISRTLPEAATSVSASIVSSIGVSTSKRWHW